MAVVDTRITDWSETAADNTPDGGVKIVRDLGRQFRNIKSVVRKITKSKSTEQPDGFGIDEFTEAASNVFTFTGDVRDKVQVGQMIFGYDSSDQLRYEGYVTAVGYSTVTAVVVDWIVSAGGTIAYFALGCRRDPPVAPTQFLTGEKTAGDTSTTQSVSFVDTNSNAFVLPDEAYVVDIIPRAWSADIGEMIVKSVTKTTSGFSFEVYAAPVSGVTKWGWMVRVQPWW